MHKFSLGAAVTQRLPITIGPSFDVPGMPFAPLTGLCTPVVSEFAVNTYWTWNDRETKGVTGKDGLHFISLIQYDMLCWTLRQKPGN